MVVGTQWSPKNFNALLDKERMTIRELIECTEDLFELKEEDLLAFSVGKSLLPLEELIFLSYYFGVSIDFLLGRVSDKEAKMTLYEHCNEGHLPRRHVFVEAEPTEICCVANIGWPYNFMGQVRAGSYIYAPLIIPYEVTEDILNGIDCALEALPKRQRDVILGKYRDGATLRELGEKYGISTSAVRQDLLHAFRFIDESHLSRMILYGHEYSKQENELTRRWDLVKKAKEFRTSILDNS